MRRKLLAALVAVALALPASAQHTLNVRDADIRAFIQDAARVTGRTFIIDSRVQGKVSVVTDRPLSRSEYFEIFLSTLRANGLVAVPTTGGAFRVQPIEGAATQPGRVGMTGSSRNAFVTEIFRLRSIDAASAVETVRPLVSREGSVTANRSGNSIVVADYADNIARVREVIRRIDRDDTATRLVPLANAGAREIADSLRQLVGPAGEGAAPPPVSVVAIDSSNSIALRGDAATVARFAAIAEDLDRRAESGTEIRVFWLRHADAEMLLPVLQRLVGQQPSLPAAPAGTNGESVAAGAGEAAIGPPGRSPVIVTRYEGANAIIIAGPSDVQRKLGEVVRQLDVRRDQVLVEAIIVEISDTAAKELGVQLLLAGLEGSNIPFAVTNYSNASPNILTVAGAIAAEDLRTTTTTVNGEVVTTTEDSALADRLQEAAAGEILNARGGLGGIAFRTGNAIFGAIVNAVQADSDSNLLATPSVMTLDNQEAHILVGQEIPITTGEALSDNFDNAFRTVQRQEIGVVLEVTPQINTGGTIKLDIRQEVSSIAGPVSSNFNDLILNKREIETSIIVDDGEIVGIGGLLDDNERRTIEKIPLLGDIPLLGELFKSRGRSRAKTNLMVFIRPTIMRSAADARAMTARRYGYIRDGQLLSRPDREPTIDQLVRDYMGAVPPLPAAAPADVITPAAETPTEVIRPAEVPPSEPQPDEPQP